jgi:hypothetical protein
MWCPLAATADDINIATMWRKKMDEIIVELFILNVLIKTPRLLSFKGWKLDKL